MTSDSTFLRRIRIENYRSIEVCDFTLAPLTFLVGPNGSGKSNIVDAIAFVADALRTSLESAASQREGIASLLRRGPSGWRAPSFTVELHYVIARGHEGVFRIEIGADDNGSPKVLRELCTVSASSRPEHASPHSYEVVDGTVRSTINGQLPPATKTDRLYLPAAAYSDVFLPVHDTLSAMAAYHIDPRELRPPRKPESGNLLKRHGENVSSVLASTHFADHGQLERIKSYLGAMVPDLQYAGPADTGGMKSLRFHQRVDGENLEFYSASMSDGTLRAVGVLTALFQPRNALRLVAIEEPELALHPAAAGVLLDALREASSFRQVLATTHSPELLDDPSLLPESILAVERVEGKTHVGPLNEVLLDRLRRNLSTPGKLLRQNQVHPTGHDTVEVDV